jgi:hypothetical protein
MDNEDDGDCGDYGDCGDFGDTALEDDLAMSMLVEAIEGEAATEGLCVPNQLITRATNCGK